MGMSPHVFVRTSYILKSQTIVIDVMIIRVVSLFVVFLIGTCFVTLSGIELGKQYWHSFSARYQAFPALHCQEYPFSWSALPPSTLFLRERRRARGETTRLRTS